MVRQRQLIELWRTWFVIFVMINQDNEISHLHKMNLPIIAQSFSIVYKKVLKYSLDLVFLPKTLGMSIVTNNITKQV